MLSVIFDNVFMSSVVMLNVGLLSVVRVSVSMQNVEFQSVVTTSVILVRVAAQKSLLGVMVNERREFYRTGGHHFTNICQS